MYFIKCFDFVTLGWKSLYFIKACDRRPVLFSHLLLSELFIRAILFDSISILNLKLWSSFSFKNCTIAPTSTMVLRTPNVINFAMWWYALANGKNSHCSHWVWLWKPHWNSTACFTNLLTRVQSLEPGSSSDLSSDLTHHHSVHISLPHNNNNEDLSKTLTSECALRR